jgi:hypothetical protein
MKLKAGIYKPPFDRGVESSCLETSKILIGYRFWKNEIALTIRACFSHKEKKEVRRSQSAL